MYDVVLAVLPILEEKLSYAKGRGVTVRIVSAAVETEESGIFLRVKIHVEKGAAARFAGVFTSSVPPDGSHMFSFKLSLVERGNLLLVAELASARTLEVDDRSQFNQSVQQSLDGFVRTLGELKYELNVAEMLSKEKEEE